MVCNLYFSLRKGVGGYSWPWCYLHKRSNESTLSVQETFLENPRVEYFFQLNVYV